MMTLASHSTFALAALLCLTACPRSDRVLATPAAEAGAPSPGIDASTAAPGVDEGPSNDLARKAGLGQPCPGDGADAGARGAALALFCDGEGRIAGAVYPVDVLTGVPPPSAEIVFEAKDPSGAPGQSLTVAVEGERLWIRRVTCGRCRRVLGWSLVADLPRTGAEDLRQLQVKLGLASLPPLRDARAWRKASSVLAAQTEPGGRDPWVD